MVLKVRQSTISSFEICPRRAQYTVHPPEGFIPTTGEPREVGTAYHNGLEAYYKHRKQTGECTPVMDAIYQAAIDSLDDVTDRLGTDWIETSREAVQQRVLTMLFNYFNEGHQWGDAYEVLGIETSFAVPMGEYVSTGTIDLVLKCTDGILLVDHKTAGKPWPKNKGTARSTPQPATYVDAWSQMTDTPVEDISFVFDVMTYDGRFTRRVCDITTDDIKRVREQAKCVAVATNAGIELPGNPTSFLCSEKWCDYWQHCPFGAGVSDNQATEQDTQ